MKRRLQLLRGLSLLAVFSLVISQATWAQQVTANITGTVADQSGAPIVGATVTASDSNRGTVWTTKTNESGIFNILIVAEPAKLLGYEVGTLADYIAMLALSQAGSLDTCQDMPSISNLLVKDCGSSAIKITDADLAYLRGLYSLPKGYSLSTQRSGIGFQMKKVLVTDKGG